MESVDEGLERLEQRPVLLLCGSWPCSRAALACFPCARPGSRRAVCTSACGLFSSRRVRASSSSSRRSRSVSSRCMAAVSSREPFSQTSSWARISRRGVSHQFAHEMGLAAQALAAGGALGHADGLVQAFRQRQLFQAFGRQGDQLLAQVQQRVHLALDLGFAGTVVAVLVVAFVDGFFFGMGIHGKLRNDRLGYDNRLCKLDSNGQTLLIPAAGGKSRAFFRTRRANPRLRAPDRRLGRGG